MGKKTKSKSQGRPDRGRRKGSGGSPRKIGARRLQFSETAQEVVCGLLCDLRLREVQLARRGSEGEVSEALEKEAARLQRAQAQPRKVLKALQDADREARRQRRRAVEEEETPGAVAPEETAERPAAAVVGPRVRLVLQKRGGKNVKEIPLVLKRSPDLTNLLVKAKAKLKTKKMPRVAYLVYTKERLVDTLSVPDGTAVMVSDTERDAEDMPAPPQAAASPIPAEEVEAEAGEATRKRPPMVLGSTMDAAALDVSRVRRHFRTSFPGDGEEEPDAGTGTCGDADADRGEGEKRVEGESKAKTGPRPVAPRTVGDAASDTSGEDDDDDKDRDEDEDSSDDGPDAPAEARDARSAVLRTEQSRLDASPAYVNMLRQRRPLPAFQARDEILAAVAAQQVTVISGATGCGKTTQIPQLLLEEAYRAGAGATTSIICTQPRRISAIGVAERVAQERCARIPGAHRRRGRGRDRREATGDTGDVGYQIRLERCATRDTRLLFCTTGILLRRLQSDDDLRGVSHVIVDEAHERNLQSDFLLIILRSLLRRRRDLKLVIMSATLQSELFCEYFGVGDAIQIPGRLHPVDIQYLPGVVTFVRRYLPTSRSAQDLERRLAGGRGRGRRREARPDRGGLALAPEPAGAINYGLVVDLVRAIGMSEPAKDWDGSNGGTPPGAILIFCPGQAEISRLVGTLNQARDAGNRLWVLPLHASLPAAAQRLVFQRPPEPTWRKVVVATNVAETSITIEDATHVIDLGRVREIRYESGAKVSVLKEVMTSQASAQQRAGRAGRVRAGRAWRLYGEEIFEEDLPEHTAPEMLRTPLDELILQVLLLRLGQPRAFLRRALQAPPRTAVNAAVANLVAIGAVTEGVREGDGAVDGDIDAGDAQDLEDEAEEDEQEEGSNEDEGDEHDAAGDDDDGGGAFDEAGSAEARSAASDGARAARDDPEAGRGSWGRDASPDGAGNGDGEDDGGDVADKDLLCLTPLGFHLAQLPMDCRVGKILLYGAIFGCLSPMLSIAGALSTQRGLFLETQSSRQRADKAKAHFAQGSESDLVAAANAYEAWADARDARAFCREHCLNLNSLEEVNRLRQQFLSHLQRAGLAGDVDGSGPGSRRANVELLKGLVCAGLYPNLVQAVRTSDKKMHLLDHDGARWFCHPRSVNFRTLGARSGAVRPRYVVYSARLRTTQPYLLDTTLVSPLALLLFGGRLQLTYNRNGLVMDSWLGFRTTEHAALVLRALRREIEALLLRRVGGAAADEAGEAVLDTVAMLLGMTI